MNVFLLSKVWKNVINEGCLFQWGPAGCTTHDRHKAEEPDTVVSLEMSENLMCCPLCVLYFWAAQHTLNHRIYWHVLQLSIVLYKTSQHNLTLYFNFTDWTLQTPIGLQTVLVALGTLGFALFCTIFFFVNLFNFYFVCVLCYLLNLHKMATCNLLLHNNLKRKWRWHCLSCKNIKNLPHWEGRTTREGR